MIINRANSFTENTNQLLKQGNIDIFTSKEIEKILQNTQRLFSDYKKKLDYINKDVDKATNT